MKDRHLPLFRAILLVVALLSAIMCVVFGEATVKYQMASNFPINYPVADSGLNGGACGMGILSGLSLLAISITYIKSRSD